MIRSRKGAEFDRMAEMYSEDETTQQVGEIGAGSSAIPLTKS